MKRYNVTVILVLVFGLSFAQDSNESVIDDACSCISKIQLDLQNKETNEEIKSCITGSIVSAQINNSIFGSFSKVIDTLRVLGNEADSLVIKSNDNNIIIADKDYDKIEENLLENCQALKILITNDNTAHENSVSDKKKAIAYYNEGIVYYNNQEYANALPKLEKAVKADKSFGYAWDNLGICQRKVGDYKSAIKSYEKSLKLDPKGRVPLMNIPIVYESLEDYDNAILAYKRFSKVYPDDPEVYYGLSRMYHLKKDYDNALDSVFKAYLMYKETKSPYVRDAEKNIGVFYRELKEVGQLDLFNSIAEKYNIKIN